MAARRRPRAAQGKSSSNRLRIIGGQWRGRLLDFPDAEGLRPTGDRMRETLFNWLQWEVPGGRCLDLFAGSGALGLEAASRGAKEVVCVEKNPRVSAQLARNVQLLEASKVQVCNETAEAFLSRSSTPFDVVFLDPPFDQGLWQSIVNTLCVSGLTQGAHIYVETPREQALDVPEHWHLKREKCSGMVCARLFCTD